MREQVELRTEFTRGPGHATELAAEAAGEADAIVVFAGDGTYNEAMNGADGALPFGFLPGGGTSVFPRALGLPRDPGDAARVSRPRSRSAAPPDLARRRQRAPLLLLRRDRLRRRGGPPARPARPRRCRRAPGRPAFVRTVGKMIAERRGRWDPALEIEGTGGPRSSSSPTATRTPTPARSRCRSSRRALRARPRLRRTGTRAARSVPRMLAYIVTGQRPAERRRRLLRARPRPDRGALRPAAAVTGGRRGPRRRRDRGVRGGAGRGLRSCLSYRAAARWRR